MSWPVRVVDATGSTNADLAQAARSGDGGPRFLLARAQTSARGRLGRQWQSPAGSSVSLSLLWSPTVPDRCWSWLPLVVGLAVVDAVATLGLRDVALKWPNDVVVPRPAAAPTATGADGRVEGAMSGLGKLAGVLVERVVPSPAGPPTVVAGVGLNLDASAAGSMSTAASLSEQLGRSVSFEEASHALASRLERQLLAWQAAGGDPGASGALDRYRRACTTLGRRVVVHTPGGALHGEAVDLDRDGSLVVVGPHGTRPVSAGDVEHVR